MSAEAFLQHPRPHRCTRAHQQLQADSSASVTGQLEARRQEAAVLGTSERRGLITLHYCFNIQLPVFTPAVMSLTPVWSQSGNQTHPVNIKNLIRGRAAVSFSLSLISVREITARSTQHMSATQTGRTHTL